jgi:hypothetical protein
MGESDGGTSNNGGGGGPSNNGGGDPNNGGGGPNDYGPTEYVGGGANNQGTNDRLPSQDRLAELADYIEGECIPGRVQTLNSIGIKFRQPFVENKERLSRTAMDLKRADPAIFNSGHNNPAGLTRVSRTLANKIRNARPIHTCCHGQFLTTLSKDNINTKNTRNTTNYSETPVNSSATQGGGKGSGLNTAIKSNEVWL